jgi:3-methyl-2-oxobutanoate hydroxymethyltransferase
LGGYGVQGRTLESANELLADAQALEDAGVFALVLEAVPRELAAMITRRLRIPTIGIGAGPDCDGQVIVFHDIAGLTFQRPAKFVRPYADVRGTLHDALLRFKEDVKEGRYPGDNESYHCPVAVMEQFEKEVSGQLRS